MNKKRLNLNLFAIIAMVFLSYSSFSCSNDEDEKLDDGSTNTTDVAVTSNVSKLGITYAYIDGYVNLNLITSSYSNQQLGIELSLDEHFLNSKQALTKELEGNKLTVVIDTLRAQTTYYYRTFVKVNDLSFYGEKRSFTTKGFSNITSTGEASEITLTSAKIKCSGDASNIDKENKFYIGIALSKTKSGLHPDSTGRFLLGDYVLAGSSFYRKVCRLDSLVKNKSFEGIITGLQAGTTYYYCSFTYAGMKFKFGEVKSFTTKQFLESMLTTGEATDITLTSATIKSISSLASIYPKGTKINYYLDLGLSQEQFFNHYSNGITHNISQEGIITSKIRQLEPDTTYYYRICAYVDDTYLFGSTKSFSTKSVDSYLTTEDATDITHKSATLKGKTTLSKLYGEDESSIRYCFIFSENKGSFQILRAQKNGNELTATEENLVKNQTYYYSIRADIDGQYIYSNIKSFTTKAAADY